MSLAIAFVLAVLMVVARHLDAKWYPNCDDPVPLMEPDSQVESFWGYDIGGEG